MGEASTIESLYNCAIPTKKRLHLYAIGGNSILMGTVQYVTTYSGDAGMGATYKAKYWTPTHTNVWRLSGGYRADYERKEYQFYYNNNGADAKYQSSMILFPRLYELYGGDVHIGFCDYMKAGTGFKYVGDSVSWNINEPFPEFGAPNSFNYTKNLAYKLRVLKQYFEGMGYDVVLKGVIFMGQAGIDVYKFGTTYDKATFKTDLSDIISYFRTDLGFTDIPFYMVESTDQGYPAAQAEWNDACLELGVSLGGVYVFYGHHWWNVSGDNVHNDGASGVLAWGEGAETEGHKNLAELIYSVENP